MKARRSSISIFERYITALLIFSPLFGCAGVTPIDVHDDRLPLEARMWVGGAEDAVAIAVANRDDAEGELAEVIAWQRSLPKSIGSPALDAAYSGWAGARLRLAQAALDRARMELDLARIARTVTHAETAMRYDLAVYDLDALRAGREAVRVKVEAAGRQVEEATVAREVATSGFWSAYRQAGQSPELARLFWWAPLR